MVNLFNGAYQGQRVLVTGHTGFKGSWLCHWLKKMGAEVFGYSIDTPTSPAHIDLLDLSLKEKTGDVADREALTSFFDETQPDIVFHLAAQPLVRKAYREPYETFHSNVLGTMATFLATRDCPSVKALVNVTTDKVYFNNEWCWPYREDDRIGGNDVYSASKAAVEVMTESLLATYFPVSKLSEHGTLIGVARAGNVIGGGDWAQDRLIPDLIRAAEKGDVTSIRNPHSVRPWQHVLESLSGYLVLGEKLLQQKTEAATTFNFGPAGEADQTVEEVIQTCQQSWAKIQYKVDAPEEKIHESRLLRLDSAKAWDLLKWKPVWDAQKTVATTIDWYKSHNVEARILTDSQLTEYIADAKKSGLSWACGE